MLQTLLEQIVSEATYIRTKYIDTGTDHEVQIQEYTMRNTLIHICWKNNSIDQIVFLPK